MQASEFPISEKINSIIERKKGKEKYRVHIIEDHLP